MRHVLEGIGGLLALFAAVGVGVYRPRTSTRRPGYIERNPDSSRLGLWQTHDLGGD